jgi:shikimate dehydrogenase
MKKFAVVGNPIDHSLSPLIHKCFAEQMQVEMTYEKILIDPSSFKEKILLLSESYHGLNITLPFKQLAVEISNFTSTEVKKTNSANTITFENSFVKADNTDGYGLITDLNDNGFNLKNSNILLLGAGGAANGVIYRILNEKPAGIFLHNRTIEKSKTMVKNWNHESIKDSKIELYNSEYCDKIDLVINATSSSLNSIHSPIDLSVFNKQTICYDMMYGFQTPFIESAKKNKLNFLDGTGMLVNQAAESFRIWNKIKIDRNIIKIVKDKIF